MAVETIGANTVSTRGTTVVTHASANTKGDWTELVASTSAAARGLLITHADSTTTDFLIDIGTGAGGAESALIANYPSNHRTSEVHTQVFYFPVAIAAGTRISARAQSAAGGSNLAVTGYLLSTGVSISDMTSLVSYGANTTDSGGVEIDPGAVAHTKGSWIEITSSLSEDVKFLMPLFAAKNNTARTTCQWFVDIGTGAESSESVVVANLHIEAHSGNDPLTPESYPPLPVEIAAGTRVAVRAQCDITDATDRLFDFIMLTANGTASATGGMLIHPGMSGGMRG